MSIQRRLDKAEQQLPEQAGLKMSKLASLSKEELEALTDEEFAALLEESLPQETLELIEFSYGEPSEEVEG